MEKYVPLHEHLIDPSSPVWDDVLARADHDFYHLPCYQRLSAAPDEVPRAFLASQGEHRLLLPFLQRPIPVAIAGREGLFDTTSAYGYPGPIATRDAPPEFVRNALLAFSSTLANENIVASFTRLHTLLNDSASFENVGELVTHGSTVYVDLQKSDEQLWTDIRPRHSRDIVALGKRGFRMVMDGWNRLDDFIACYYESMRRVEASPFYFFTKEYFESLRDCVGVDRIHLCLLLHDDELVCGTLVTEMDGLCQYHLSGTSDKYLPERPSKLMLHLLSKHLKAQGNRVFHLGGGVGGARDSLYLFKSGFSPHSADFHTWRVVSAPDRYDELLDRWRALSDREPVERDAFFPQYRAPIGG